MSSFKSDAARATAQSGVNKLLANFLPSSERISEQKKRGGRSSSGAAIISQKIESKRHLKHNEEVARKEKLKSKISKRQKILQNSQKGAEVKKVAKINKLKKEKRYDDEELQAIIDKKITTIKSWENSQLSEVRTLEREILALTSADQNRRTKVKSKNQKKADFNRKLQRGVVAYPGLTPGLAPVDLTDGSDDESD